MGRSRKKAGRRTSTRSAPGNAAVPSLASIYNALMSDGLGLSSFFGGSSNALSGEKAVSVLPNAATSSTAASSPSSLVVSNAPAPKVTRGKSKQKWTREVSIWQHVFGRIIHAANRSSGSSDIHVREAKFESDRQFKGACVDETHEYQSVVELDHDDRTYDYDCACGQCQESSPCRHVIELAKVGRALLSKCSPEQYLQLQFSKDVPESPADRVEKLLDRYLKRLAQRMAKSAALTASPTETPSTVMNSRLGWLLTFSPSYLSIEPLRQKPRKTGRGWTRGTRMDWYVLNYELRDLGHTPQDEQIVAAYKRLESQRYVRNDFRETANSEFVRLLAGHPGIIIQEAPGRLEWRELALRLVRQDDRYVLMPASGHSTRPIVLKRLLLSHDPSSNHLVAMPLDRAQSDLLKGLMSADCWIPAERIAEFKPKLDQLMQGIALECPPELAGPILPAQMDSVALLRSWDTGELEIDLRVRDSQGNLYRPGEGTLLSVGELNGAPVQWQRDSQAERERLQAIVDRLRLAAVPQVDAWNWRISNFMMGMQLLEDLDRLSSEMGFHLVWDPKTAKSMVVLGSVSPQNVRVSVTRQRDWFGLQGNCQVGDEQIPLSELLQALEQEPRTGYHELRPGQWAKISAELRQGLRKLSDSLHRQRSKLEFDLTAVPAVQELSQLDVTVEQTQVWYESLQRIQQAQALDPTPPAEFQAKLRGYQLQGYKWLRRLAEWGVGACLADDMGLGKTIQALAILVDRQQLGPSLVIAPTSVGFNWQREAEKFAPTLKVRQYRETSRAEFVKDVGPQDLVICSYGLALRDQEHLREVQWGTLVLDESQNIKNSQSKTARAIREFTADWRVALSGTPLENHLGELWSLFRTISPGLLGSWDRFRQRFAAPIERDHDDERREALSRVIRPFVLRRTKEEVLDDLPPRTETNIVVDLPPDQRRRYDEMRLAAVNELDHIVGVPETADRRFRVLAIMTRLRQLACHIGLVDASWTGSSAKLDVLVEKMQELRDEGHRVLIFSQFTEHLALIRTALDQAGITYEYLDGSTTPAQRQIRVDRFQAGSTNAFLISLKAGGTGLNLTGADYVIHMDPWWNPAVEDQATDRAHRIGQTKPVMVYRLIARGTIEEEILNLHAEKRDLVAGILEGTQAAGKLSTQALVQLIKGGLRECSDQ